VKAYSRSRRARAPKGANSDEGVADREIEVRERGSLEASLAISSALHMHVRVVNP